VKIYPDAASSDAEKIAGRIVEYGTAVEAANRSGGSQAAKWPPGRAGCSG
jgi:hypothetical protein